MQRAADECHLFGGSDPTAEVAAMKLTRECIGDKAKARFWAKVDRQFGPTRPGDLGPCWPWLNARSGEYGSINVGNGQGTTHAHRVAFVLAGGDLPDDKPQVLHRCDNPPCCNPDHLFAGTHRDNMADRDAKGRVASGERNGMRRHPERSGPRNNPECVCRGERQWCSRLTRHDVVEIRMLVANGANQTRLAESRGVSDRTINDVVQRRTWKHVPCVKETTMGRELVVVGRKKNGAYGSFGTDQVARDRWMTIGRWLGYARVLCAVGSQDDAQVLVDKLNDQRPAILRF